jgi:hypothetical protein
MKVLKILFSYFCLTRPYPKRGNGLSVSGRSHRCRLLPVVQTRAINLTRMVESGSLGIGFHCGAVDEALLKIIQTLF